MQEYTLLSIITPVYNRVDFIEKAIRSVQNQDYPSVEHLIIDGGSDDGTHEILTRYPHIKLTSEPDKGVFDAMNKGIQRARGEILGFLNSDDVYEPYIFNEVMRVFKDNPEVMAINGGAKVVRETMTENTMDSRYFPPISTDDIYERTTLGSPIFNAWFFRKTVFSILGNLDTNYKLIADRKFLIELGVQAIKYCCIDRNFYIYYSHEGSLTIKPKNDWESPLFQEITILCQQYLTKKDFHSQQKKYIRLWYRKISLEMTVAAIHKKALNRAAIYACKAIKYDPLWLIYFITRLFSKIIHIFKITHN